MHFDDSNDVYRQALTFINSTNKHVFLSGKAGTGKTTFLKKLKELTYKKLAIASPTGVAAVNAEGVTIHALVNLPIGMYIPDNQDILSGVRLDSTKRTLIKELELLVIDEVSMLRADAIDAVDYIFRQTRNQLTKPFGGVQVVYIGDLFQLPPVITNNEWEQLKRYYSSIFFIDSRVFVEAQPIVLELTKIYRQVDPNFIDLLNSIRDNSIEQSKLDWLNVTYVERDNDNYCNHITLTTHNDKANKINIAKYNNLDGVEFNFEASLTGVFDESILPVEKELKLKIGAQVMVLKNDKAKTKKYFNGKIGVVDSISADVIFIKFDSSEILAIERETWRNLDYQYETSTKNIVQTEIGTFSQFPLRLAWAITIHKSQGLTFDNATVDAGNAFSPGQVYVALSRLRSLNGLHLKSFLTTASILVNPRVTAFYLACQMKPSIDLILAEEESLFIKNFIIDSFEWDTISNHLNSETDLSIPIFSAILNLANNHNKFANRFIDEISRLKNLPRRDIQMLRKRVDAATSYFLSEIEEKIQKPLKDFVKTNKNDINYKRYIPFAKNLISTFETKSNNLKSVKEFVQGLVEQKNVAEIMKLIRLVLKKPSQLKPNPANKVGVSSTKSTESISLQLFIDGKSIEEIAEYRSLTKAAIEKHLSLFIKTGEIQIEVLLERSLLEQIQVFLRENNSRSVVDIKQHFGDNISIGQINAAIIYHDFIANNQV